MTRWLMVGLLFLASTVAPASYAANFAGMSFCGGTVVPGDPTDLEHQVGEMSLQAAVDQPASITSCSKGYLLAKCGDHENANKIFDKCIAAGYAGAMIWRALETENGNGTPKDLKAAAELLRRAATSGDPAYEPIGKLHYATVLYHGRGLPQNQVEAMRWFREAAAQGNAEAAEFLRTGYHTGARDLEGMGAGVPTAAAQAPMLTAAGEAARPVAVAGVVSEPLQGKEHVAVAMVSLDTPQRNLPPVLAPRPAAMEPEQTGLQLKAVAAAEEAESRQPLYGLIGLLVGAFLLGALRRPPLQPIHVRRPITAAQFS